MLLGLRKKTVAPGSSGFDERGRGGGSTDLFGVQDALVKHVLEVGCIALVMNRHLSYDYI